MSPDVPFAGAKTSGISIEIAAHGLIVFAQAKISNYAKAVKVDVA